MNLNIMKVSTRLPEAQIFRHLRISSGLTTRKLSQLMECTNSLVTHFESGRNPLPKHRKKQICEIFNITPEILEAYSTGQLKIPINYRDECVLQLSKMNESNLQAVYGILSNMNK
jgi:transcriptional regulator with XRE-family HTH domain